MVINSALLYRNVIQKFESYVTSHSEFYDNECKTLFVYIKYCLVSLNLYFQFFYKFLHLQKKYRSMVRLLFDSNNK